MQNMELRLAALEARAAIEQVVYRYCRALDRLDEPLLRAVFHDECAIDMGALYRGGPDGFVRLAMEFMGAMAATRHEVANIVLEIEADHASAESYVTAWHRLAGPDGEAELIVRARYLNAFAFRDGRWAITRHSEVLDYGARLPTDPAWFEGNAELEKGARTRADASYGFLPALRR